MYYNDTSVYYLGPNMKFSVKKEDLLNALGIATRAVSSKAMFSIYQNIKIIANENEVTFMGTDGELTIKASCDANVEVKGVVFVKMDLFYNLVRNFDAKEYLFAWQDNKLSITSERNKNKSLYAYKTIEDENNRFPNLEFDQSSLIFSFSAYKMKRTFNEIVFAAVIDTGNNPAHFTHGVLFKFYDNSLDLVATDAHRMALRTLEYNKEENTNLVDQIIIPTNVISILNGCLSDDKDFILKFYKHNNRIIINFDRVTIGSSLIDVSFPDYKRIIVKNVTQTIEVEREELKSALNRILIIAKYNTRNPAIHMNGKGNTLKLELDNDLVKCEEDLESINNFTEFKIAYNPELLLDCLKAIDCERILLRWVSEKDPMMLNLKYKDKDSWAEDNDYKYLLMPVRT